MENLGDQGAAAVLGERPAPGRLGAEGAVFLRRSSQWVPDISGTHLAPYVVITILLAMFPMLHFYISVTIL